MRRTLLLIPLLALAGCAGNNQSPGVATANGGATPTASASSQPSEGDPLKHAQCMRENGLPGFEDPEPDQKGIRIKVPKGTDKKKVDAAMAACKQYLPNGGEPRKLDPAITAKLREFAKCMRANGVPEFPDPQADGGLEIRAQKGGNLDPESAAFKKADAACAQYRPEGPGGGGKQVEKG
jgi:hypothetical protein